MQVDKRQDKSAPGASVEQAAKRWLPATRSIFWWLVASLVAVAALQINALLGLTVAIVGGIVFGILLFVE